MSLTVLHSRLGRHMPDIVARMSAAVWCASFFLVAKFAATSRFSLRHACCASGCPDWMDDSFSSASAIVNVELSKRASAALAGTIRG